MRFARKRFQHARLFCLADCHINLHTSLAPDDLQVNKCAGRSFGEESMQIIDTQKRFSIYSNDQVSGKATRISCGTLVLN